MGKLCLVYGFMQLYCQGSLRRGETHGSEPGLAILERETDRRWQRSCCI